MNARTKVVLAAIAVILVGVAVVLAAVRGRDGGAQVRTEEVARRDLVQLVTASGNIRARRAVELSSDISARVSELLVEEGEDVTEGQVLLRLDPAQYQAGVSRARAALSQAEAQEAQQEANLIQAQRNLDRLLALRGRDSLLVSPQQIDDGQTAVEVAEATLGAARFGVSQARASLDEAEDFLSRTVIRAPMSGKVTRLNVEEGETVIIGTMNNPGSLILTISDLSVVEVVVQVDETDVPEIELGDSAAVRIDAFGDRTFTGRVTEIGNSAIRPPSSQQTTGQQAAIDFEVVITLDSTGVPLRPDLSATADVVTATREDALAVPIIALTVREGAGDEAEPRPDGEGTRGSGAAPSTDREGVFVIREGTVRFTPVTVGITGQEHFEVLAGVEAGDSIVAGPYQTIRQLADGDRVTRAEEEAGGVEDAER